MVGHLHRGVLKNLWDEVNTLIYLLIQCPTKANNGIFLKEKYLRAPPNINQFNFFEAWPIRMC